MIKYGSMNILIGYVQGEKRSCQPDGQEQTKLLKILECCKQEAELYQQQIERSLQALY